MRLNLTACGAEFVTGNYPDYVYNYPEYTYNGPRRGVLKHVEPPPPLITVQGCKKLCGEGSDYYSWVDVSSTITTWVRLLPHQMRFAAYADRYCPSSVSSYRPPSKVIRTSTASWRSHVGSATRSRASPTSCGTLKSLANVL